MYFRTCINLALFHQQSGSKTIPQSCREYASLHHGKIWLCQINIEISKFHNGRCNLDKIEFSTTNLWLYPKLNFYKMARNSLYLLNPVFHAQEWICETTQALGALNHQIPQFLITLIDFVIKYTVKSPWINILGTARSTSMLTLDRNHKVIPSALAYYKFSHFRYFSYLELWMKKIKTQLHPTWLRHLD